MSIWSGKEIDIAFLPDSWLVKDGNPISPLPLMQTSNMELHVVNMINFDGGE